MHKNQGSWVIYPNKHFFYANGTSQN